MEAKYITEVSKKEQEQARINLIRSTVCPGASDDELELFLYTCKRTKLDPLMKQIYFVKRNNKFTIQTAIDGFRLVADRTGKYSAGREPTYTYDDKKNLRSATAYVKKRTPDGVWHEVSATAFWAEYAVYYDGMPSTFWKKMPHLMLAKCAESLALRKAFPAELSGLYTDSEMDQAEKAEQATLDLAQVNHEKKMTSDFKDHVNDDEENIDDRPIEAYLDKVQVAKLEMMLGKDYDLADRILKGWSEKYNAQVDTFYDIKAADFDKTLQRLSEIKAPGFDKTVQKPTAIKNRKPHERHV